MKKEINKTLGNSLRCILPSFWWKRLLGKMVDKIESAESSASSAMKIATLAGLEASDKQDRLVSGSNIKTICGKSILGSGNITPDPSMKVYIPMGGALDSYYQSYNQSFYRRVKDGGNWENSWRAIAVTASANMEVVLLGVSYNTTQGCRILISGFQEEDITDKYECVLLEDGSVSSVTKVEGESGGSSITIDSELSATSENPVQNKVIYENLCEMSDEYTQMYEELGASVHEMSVDLYTKLLKKVDYVAGKQLSTEDFTSALKAKLEGLSNYDDTSIQNALNSLTTQINTLVSGDASVAIESFNEIIAFLNGVEDSENLDSIIAAIEQQIASVRSSVPTKTSQLTNDSGFLTQHQDISNLATKAEVKEKQDAISDLDTIRSGAAKGATALQSVPDTYATKTNLAEALAPIGTLYKGAWTATKTEGISQLYTERITLPAGTYIISAVLPYAKVGHGNKICIGFTASMAIGVGNTFLDASYGCTTMLATFTTTTNLAVMSAASANSAEWDYLDRGGIAALRIK